MNINGKKGSISNVLLIIISALVLLIAIIFYVYVNNNVKNNTKSSTNNKKSSKTSISSDKNDNDSSNISSEDLIKWVGHYKNGDIQLDIALFAHNLLKFRFYEEYSSDNYFGIDGTQIECPVKNGEKISYKDIFNNELRYEINATHTNDTLSIKASAPNTNNYLNKVSGNYVKEEFEGSGWTGIYSGDNEMYISLTEFQDNISIAIEKDSKKTDEIARMLRNSNDYDEKMITWNNISIEKIDNGIKVEINSSDEELDEFGKISGEYSRL